MRVEDGFQQTPYDILHPYSDDPILPALLKRLLPESILKEVNMDLMRVGDRLVRGKFDFEARCHFGLFLCVSGIRPLSPLVHQASLTQYDHWGRRIDDLQTSEGWRKLEKFAIEEGYVAIAYERKYGDLSRIYSFAKNMVLTGDCHVIMCPMGMTDGAARSLELAGTDKMKRDILPKLTSRDVSNAYLSGQWMTERPGGSDLSQTETTAVLTSAVSSDLGTPYLLNGMKWFSSAAEGNIAVALARTGTLSQASRGLSLFVIPLRHGPYSSPLSNGVKMHRLKNKIGTYGVPTAELSLENTRGWLVGELGQGVKTIATVLNITRIHSAIHLVGSLQRCLAIARSYAQVRTINGGKTRLCDVPLHMATLADVSLLYKAVTFLTFGTIELLGKSECGTATEAEEMKLRLLTPAIKGYAAVKCPTAMEEMMGALGGLGYMEEVGIGRLIRDSLVERIWEGTVNVLALDLLRAARDPKTVEAYMEWAQKFIASTLDEPMLASVRASILRLAGLVEFVPLFLSHAALNPLLPRIVLSYFASISCAIFLLQHAVWAVTSGEESRDVDVESFRRWVDEGDVHGYVKEIDALTKSERVGREQLNSRLVYGSKL